MRHHNCPGPSAAQWSGAPALLLELSAIVCRERRHGINLQAPFDKWMAQAADRLKVTKAKKQSKAQQSKAQQSKAKRITSIRARRGGYATPSMVQGLRAPGRWSHPGGFGLRG